MRHAAGIQPIFRVKPSANVWIGKLILLVERLVSHVALKTGDVLTLSVDWYVTSGHRMLRSFMCPTAPSSSMALCTTTSSTA